MTIFKKICTIAWSVLWRIGLVVLILALILTAGVGMFLSVALNGPSDTVRATLTATLLEYEATRAIPAYFLDQAAINEILSAADVLPATVSDPSMITPAAGAESGSSTLQAANYTAEITLLNDPAQADFPASGGDYFAGLTADGVLVVSTSSEEAEALDVSGRCEKILIMNGQVNTGLYEAASGLTSRAAIGQRADGVLILVTVTGGTKEQPGGTWQDLIDIMTEYGAVNACSLTPMASEE